MAKEWPIASESRMVNTFHGRTFVRIGGPVGAPPLVLLPGAGTNSLMWMSNIEALSECYRTYAVDNICDYGRSVCMRTISGPDDFVVWLDELFSVLELGNSVNLVGMSYGGWLTSQYALRLQSRLDKIVLIAPAATVIPLQLEFLVRLLLSLAPYRCFTESMMHWLAADLARKGEAGRRMVEAAVDGVFTARRCFKSRHLVLPTVLGDEEWQSIRVPTLYLVGENEKIYSARKAVQRLNDVATHIKAEIIPNAGHDLTFVQVEMVNSEILEFLKQS